MAPVKFTLKDTQEVILGVVAKDRVGQDAALDGPVVWSITENTAVELISIDATHAKLRATGESLAQNLQVTATADADTGEGVVPIVDTLTLDVVAGQATGLGIVPGEPTEVE